MAHFLFVEMKTETLMRCIHAEYNRRKKRRKRMIKNRKINEKDITSINDITYLIQLHII